jgi:EAL domain-containing protein (putative c-di-GMP-specific phosphodiesterase class I)
VHVLKLAKSFVEGFRPEPRGTDESTREAVDEKIVTALVRLAHVLGITVTAEGIESAGQAERLRLTGCDSAQGWHFGKAGPAEEITRLLSR